MSVESVDVIAWGFASIAVVLFVVVILWLWMEDRR